MISRTPVTGLTKTRYDAGEAQTKLQQTSAYYDNAIEKSKPAHQTDLDKNWIQVMNWRSEEGLIDLLLRLPFVQDGGLDLDRGRPLHTRCICRCPCGPRRESVARRCDSCG